MLRIMFTIIIVFAIIFQHPLGSLETTPHGYGGPNVVSCKCLKLTSISHNPHLHHINKRVRLMTGDMQNGILLCLNISEDSVA